MSSLGVQASAVDVPREIFWGGNAAKQAALVAANQLIDSSVTIGSPVSGQPATKWPAGLIVAKLTATKKLVPWDNVGTDGSEVVYGVLAHDAMAVDEFGNAVDRPVDVVVGNAPLRSSELRVDGAAFLGHPQVADGKTELAAKNIYLDDVYCD